MCLVIIKDETKQHCCKCGGLCKREQQWAEKMDRINEVNDSVDITLLLQGKPVVQPQQSTLQNTG